MARVQDLKSSFCSLNIKSHKTYRFWLLENNENDLQFMEENPLWAQDELSEYHLACQKALEELVLWEGSLKSLLKQQVKELNIWRQPNKSSPYSTGPQICYGRIWWQDQGGPEGAAWSKWEAGPQLGWPQRDPVSFLLTHLCPTLQIWTREPSGSQLRHGGQQVAHSWPHQHHRIMLVAFNGEKIKILPLK